MVIIIYYFDYNKYSVICFYAKGDKAYEKV